MGLELGLGISPGLLGGMPRIIADDFSIDSGNWLDGALSAVAMTVASGIGIWSITLGDELLPDPNLADWGGDDTLNQWSNTESGSGDLSEVDSGQTHGGTNVTGECANFYRSGSPGVVRIEYDCVTGGLWYRTQTYVSARSGSGYIQALVGQGGQQTNFLYDIAATHTGSNVGHPSYPDFWINYAGDCDLTIDSTSIKQIATASLFRVQPIYYVSSVEAGIRMSYSHPTLYGQKGVVLYQDSDNYLLAYLDRISASKMRCLKVVGGTMTIDLCNVSFTYGEDDVLKLTLNAAGTEAALDYNGGAATASGIDVSDMGLDSGTWYAGVFSTYENGAANDGFSSFLAEAV